MGRPRQFPATIPALLDLRLWEIYEHCRARGGPQWERVYARKMGVNRMVLVRLRWERRYALGSHFLSRLERYIRRKEKFRSGLDRTLRKILKRRARVSPEWQPDAFCQAWIDEYYLSDEKLADAKAKAAVARAKCRETTHCHSDHPGFQCSMPSARPTNVIRV